MQQAQQAPRAILQDGTNKCHAALFLNAKKNNMDEILIKFKLQDCIGKQYSSKC